MARPRKPTNILKFSGAFAKNPKRARERANEPQLPPGSGSMPDWLDHDAQAEWGRIVPDLESSGVMSRVEASALGAYCLAVSHLRKAQAEVFKDGVTIMTEGGLKKHPAMNVVKDCSLLIKAFATEFGMTPSSRSRVNAKPIETPKQKEESFGTV